MYNGNNFKQFTHMAILSYGQVGWRSAVSAPVGPDADAQAFITAASITDSTQQSAINTLVTQLKTYGIWTKLKAVYPFVGGTAAQHRFNLKDPRPVNEAYYLTFNGGGVHDSNGYTMNGTTSYADTFLNGSTISGFHNNHHFSVYLKTQQPTGNGWQIGVGDTNTGNPLYGLAIRRSPSDPSYPNALIYDSGNIGQYGRIQTTITDARGLWIGSSLGSRNRVMYKNSTSVMSNYAGDAIGTLPNTSMYVGALRGSNSSPNYYLGGINSFTSIGDGLNSSEATAFYNAVQAYQTTLGRQV